MRCNYISADRADAQFCVKELCRDMSAPTTDSWIQPEDWVHLIDVQTQAKLILHVHKKQTADQDVVRLMRENDNNRSEERR